MERSEAKTRQDLTDPALGAAGWDVDDPRQVGREIPVDGFDQQAWRALDSLRTQQREAERQSEYRFQTLLHRAFRGELWEGTPVRVVTQRSAALDENPGRMIDIRGSDRDKRESRHKRGMCSGSK